MIIIQLKSSYYSHNIGKRKSMFFLLQENKSLNFSEHSSPPLFISPRFHWRSSSLWGPNTPLWFLCRGLCGRKRAFTGLQRVLDRTSSSLHGWRKPPWDYPPPWVRQEEQKQKKEWQKISSIIYTEYQEKHVIFLAGDFYSYAFLTDSHFELTSCFLRSVDKVRHGCSKWIINELTQISVGLQKHAKGLFLHFKWYHERRWNLKQEWTIVM